MVNVIEAPALADCASCGARTDAGVEWRAGVGYQCAPCFEEYAEFEEAEAIFEDVARRAWIKADVDALTSGAIIACACGAHWGGDEFASAIKTHKCAEADGLRRRRQRDHFARPKQQSESWIAIKQAAVARGYETPRTRTTPPRYGRGPATPAGAGGQIPRIEDVPAAIIDREAARFEGAPMHSRAFGEAGRDRVLRVLRERIEDARERERPRYRSGQRVRRTPPAPTPSDALRERMTRVRAPWPYWRARLCELADGLDIRALEEAA